MLHVLSTQGNATCQQHLAQARKEESSAAHRVESSFLFALKNIYILQRIQREESFSEKVGAYAMF